MAEQQSRDSIADVWGPRTPYRGEWPARVDMHVTVEPEHWVQSACMLCSNGCALDIGVKNDQIVGVRGRDVDPVNRGRLGPKGLNGWMANSSPDRLKHPLIRRHGKLEPASWDEAMELIVTRSQDVRAKYTANAMAFYNTGQLLLEEYYTLALIALGGLGTNNLDGNTRLCTATAETALRESFGTDGQPGCYADFDTTDAMFHIGHNVASQQTVLWSRILDRLHGPNPPQMVVVDPRRTRTAEAATLHLAPRAGTNLALMNGFLHLILRNGHVDQRFISEHTIGFGELEEVVHRHTPEQVAKICDVPQSQIEEAAEILGTAPTLVSTVLQGVYQSTHATATAVQVNNLHLIRGMIGKPGCTVFQMNGQPSAQNTRECGASGSFPAMLNWQNAAHLQHIAEMWNVHPKNIPSYAEPTHAMEIFRRAEAGSIRFLWILCTNPAVSLPDLDRVRRILAKSGLFVVVQEAFLTETTEFADVVLPAAIWGEKTGTFTNSERTVHLSQKAIEPPGEARSDLDILIDYARRMDLRDGEEQPLVKWSGPEEAFNAWREMTKGRPCDYSGMSYAKLTGGSGLRWPCNEHFPEGKERLYPEGIFNTDSDLCQTFGHTLLSGGELGEEVHRRTNPGGRAVLKAAQYIVEEEHPDEAFPFSITSGRVVYHFHTRTKTGRARPLQQAAPEPFIEIADFDANALSITDGDWVQVRSRRGQVSAQARVGKIRPGHIFVPFHYGSWDRSDRSCFVNDLSSSRWDPVSKQPQLKSIAGQLTRLSEPPATVRDQASGQGFLHLAKKGAYEAMALVQSAAAPTRPGQHVPLYLGMMQHSEQALTDAYERIAQRHQGSSEIDLRCKAFAKRSRSFAEVLKPLTDHYGHSTEREGEHLRQALFSGLRQGNLGMLQDLHDLHTLLGHLEIGYFALAQAGSALKDEALTRAGKARMEEIATEQEWLNRQIREVAVPALVVPTLP